MSWTRSSIDWPPPAPPAPVEVRPHTPFVIWFQATVSRRSHAFSLRRHAVFAPPVADVYDVGRADRPVRRANWPTRGMRANFRWLGCGYRLADDVVACQAFAPLAFGPEVTLDHHWRLRGAVRCAGPLAPNPLEPQPHEPVVRWDDRLRKVSAYLRTGEFEDLAFAGPTAELVDAVGYRPETVWRPDSFAATQPERWRSLVRYVDLNGPPHEDGRAYTPKQFAHSFLTGGFFYVRRSTDTGSNHTPRRMVQLGTERVVPDCPQRWRW